MRRFPFEEEPEAGGLLDDSLDRLFSSAWFNIAAVVVSALWLADGAADGVARVVDLLLL